MKITFPTDDRKTIAKRTGRCKEFAVYTIEDNIIKIVEYLKNTHIHHDHDHRHGAGHGHGRKEHKKGEGEHAHKEIGELLKDTDILIVGRVGKFMKKALEEFGIEYRLSKNPDIKESLKNYLSA